MINYEREVQHSAHVIAWCWHKATYNASCSILRGVDYRTQHDAHVRAWWPFTVLPIECGGQNDGPAPLEHTGEALNLILRLEKLAEWHEWMAERAPVLNMWPNELKVHQQASKDLRQVICEMREIFT